MFERCAIDRPDRCSCQVSRVIATICEIGTCCTDPNAPGIGLGRIMSALFRTLCVNRSNQAHLAAFTPVVHNDHQRDCPRHSHDANPAKAVL
jgi:hypothetical protein